MDDDEELFREMNPEDPYYMGERDRQPHTSRKWQPPTAGGKQGKELFRSLSRWEKIKVVLLAALIWGPILAFVLILFFV